MYVWLHTEPVDCEDGELRLVGGMNKREGNLQICFNGVWGSVCLNNRDSFLTEAAVACRQLGYNPSGKHITACQLFIVLFLFHNMFKQGR